MNRILHPSMALLAFFFAALVTATPGCGDEAGTTILPPLFVERVGPTTILPGTELVITGGGFVPTEVATLQLAFFGNVDGQPVQAVVAPARLSETELRVAVTGTLQASLISTEGTFEGHVSITRVPTFEGEVETRLLAVSLSIRSELEPFLNSISPTIFRPGDELTLVGSDFLFPSEGASIVVFDGVFRADSPATETSHQGLEVLAEAPDPTDRGRLTIKAGAGLFGIRPGTFEGEVRLKNSPGLGAEHQSEPLALGALRLEGPTIEGVSPTEASRGQYIVVNGQGLLPADPFDAAGTVFLLEGVLDADRGPSLEFTADHPLGVFPDYQPSPQQAEVVLRVVPDENGQPSGLGAVSGLFEGQVSPMLFYGSERYVGDPVPMNFRVLPAKQMVHLLFLPTFDDALLEFGLLPARAQVIARVLEVVARDYEGVNIVFGAEPPEGFEEYMVVEIGDHDPNGTGLFGLDNTAGKDIGNVRFDDVIGGFNATTRSQGFAAYGGIFVAEFMNLSASIGSSPLVDPRFDAIFASFASALGGQSVLPSEVNGQGARAHAVAEAIRVLGNLVGNTITHEVGHALGLAAVDGAFHNVGDNPGWIMDAGIHRPFGERAELPNEGPGFFSPANRSYLEEVLPL